MMQKKKNRIVWQDHLSLVLENLPSDQDSESTAALHEAGCIGLMKAADRFNSTRPFPSVRWLPGAVKRLTPPRSFSYSAGWYIRHEMSAYVDCKTYGAKLFQSDFAPPEEHWFARITKGNGTKTYAFVFASGSPHGCRFISMATRRHVHCPKMHTVTFLTKKEDMLELQNPIENCRNLLLRDMEARIRQNKAYYIAYREYFYHEQKEEIIPEKSLLYLQKLYLLYNFTWLPAPMNGIARSLLADKNKPALMRLKNLWKIRTDYLNPSPYREVHRVNYFCIDCWLRGYISGKEHEYPEV